MSYFLCDEFKDMEPYVPGEQPSDREYIKLNANETSLPPSPKVVEAIEQERKKGMGFYADPNGMELRAAIAGQYDVGVDQVFVGNGADEVLGFCFMSFFRSGMKVCFPEITYDFYRTYSQTHRLDAERIPLRDDLSIDPEPYVHTERDVILANPNNPTGLSMPVCDIERIVCANPKRMVIVDEAYVDYGQESCVPLVQKYPNVIVVQTFSKSRNLAGLHVGFAISSKAIIQDLNSMKFTFNPFNLNSLTLAAATAAVQDDAYLKKCIQQTIKTREYTRKELEKMGFFVYPSSTNFLLITSQKISAEILCAKLKARGILTRYYKQNRIDNDLRITIGTPEEMETVLTAVREILCEKKG